MDEQQAAAIAEALCGEPLQNGENTYLVMLHRYDGKIVVISDEMVRVYEHEGAFEGNQHSKIIILH